MVSRNSGVEVARKSHRQKNPLPQQQQETKAFHPSNATLETIKYPPQQTHFATPHSTFTALTTITTTTTTHPRHLTQPHRKPRPPPRTTQPPLHPHHHQQQPPTPTTTTTQPPIVHFNPTKNNPTHLQAHHSNQQQQPQHHLNKPTIIDITVHLQHCHQTRAAAPNTEPTRTRPRRPLRPHNLPRVNSIDATKKRSFK